MASLAVKAAPKGRGCSPAETGAGGFEVAKRPLSTSLVQPTSSPP